MTTNASALATATTLPVVQLPPAAPARTLEAADTDALEAYLGQTVAIHGRIVHISRNANHSLAYLEIAPVGGGATTLTGFLTGKAMHQFTVTGDGDRLDDLNGRQVVLSGPLVVRYVPRSAEKRTLEIVIDDRSQLQLTPGSK